MKTIEVKPKKQTQHGISLQQKASCLTQGHLGIGTEGKKFFPCPYPKPKPKS